MQRNWSIVADINYGFYFNQSLKFTALWASQILTYAHENICAWHFLQWLSVQYVVMQKQFSLCCYESVFSFSQIDLIDAVLISVEVKKVLLNFRHINHSKYAVCESN